MAMEGLLVVINVFTPREGVDILLLKKVLTLLN